ncbi:MAG: hypothetical protein ACP5NI_11045, partial [Acetobacteraceae bacterium]
DWYQPNGRRVCWRRRSAEGHHGRLRRPPPCQYDAAPHYHRPDDPSPPDVAAFANWFDEGLRAARVEHLLEYRRQAPYAVQNHPTEEHLLPVFVALGAAGTEPTAERLHSSAAFGVIRMDAYAFRPA